MTPAGWLTCRGHWPRSGGTTRAPGIAPRSIAQPAGQARSRPAWAAQTSCRQRSPRAVFGGGHARRRRWTCSARAGVAAPAPGAALSSSRTWWISASSASGSRDAAASWRWMFCSRLASRSGSPARRAGAIGRSPRPGAGVTRPPPRAAGGACAGSTGVRAALANGLAASPRAPGAASFGAAIAAAGGGSSTIAANAAADGAIAGSALIPATGRAASGSSASIRRN